MKGSATKCRSPDMLPEGPRSIRFGVFELDQQELELRKDGILLKLPPQPFRVLALLADREGQVVTRDEIQKLLWHDATYVDFERGINHCVSQIRAVLEDHAETPRYIKTLPRRGYRFIAPISAEQPSPKLAPGAAHSRATRLSLAITICFLAVLAVGLSVFKRASVARQRAGAVPLAVLPFENLGDDPKQAYFANAMTDALITQLGRLSELRVTSNQSSMHYAGTTSPPVEIARALNVTRIVRGSVIQSNGRVRISAQLLDASSGDFLWTDSYEGDMQNLLTLQSEVANAIASNIKGVVTLPANRRTPVPQAINPQTLEAYLRGRYYWNKRTPGGLKKSIEYFQDAIERDPTFAQAYAGMADSYNLLAYSGALPPKYAYEQATDAAMKAVRLDDTLADAHTSLADIHSVYDWNWPAAEKEYRRAIELNASYAIAHQWYASYLIAIGRSEEGIEQARKALELDPLSLMINSNLGWSYYLVRRYDDALHQFQATLELDTNFGPAHLNLGRVYEQKGNVAEAISEMKKGISLSGESPGGLAALGHAYAIFGMRSKALETIDRLMALSTDGYVAPYDIAVVYAGLGNDELALAWLQKAYENRCGELMYIKVDPRLDQLRSDNRFRVLQHKMGL